MSNKSRRRFKLATGAILAGAAIPIAAAGTAWADPTETQAQLEAQGLSSTEAAAVVSAENGTTTPVEVSFDGKVVVEANEGTGSADEATASSGRHDAVSASIGGGTDSSAKGKDALAFDEGTTTDSNSDKATAHGHGAMASIYDASTSTATADGTRATAEAEDGTTGATVSAHGTDAGAVNIDSTGSTTTANGTAAEAESYYGTDATVSAKGTDAEAAGFATDGSTATATGTGTQAVVEYTDDSTATAKGTGSGASIEGTSTSTVSDSTNLTNNGQSYTLTTSDTNWVNGAPTDSPADISAALHVPLP
jgi:hypothetical protein